MNFRLKEILKERKISQKELADKLNVTQISVSRYINGNPTVETLERIANAIGVEVRDFFEPDKQIPETLNEDDLIKKFIKDNGITSYSIANKTSISESGLNKYLSGETKSIRSVTRNVIIDSCPGLREYIENYQSGNQKTSHTYSSKQSKNNNYEIITIKESDSSSHAEFINEKSSQGWELVSVITFQEENQNRFRFYFKKTSL